MCSYLYTYDMWVLVLNQSLLIDTLVFKFKSAVLIDTAVVLCVTYTIGIRGLLTVIR